MMEPKSKYSLSFISITSSQFQQDLWASLFTSDTTTTQKQLVKKYNTHLNEPVRQGEIVILPTSEPTTDKEKQSLTDLQEEAKAAATISYSLNTLKGALSRAVNWGLIESHDLKNVTIPKEDNTRIRYLSAGEEKALLHAITERNTLIRSKRESANQHRQIRGRAELINLNQVRFVDHVEPIIILAMNSGLRKGELFSLEWSDINLDLKYLTVKGSKAKSKKNRVVPLNGTALETLVAWRKQNPEKRYVFTNGYDDQPITDIKKAWLNLLDDAEISDFRFHDLRHHFASKLVMAGVDLNTVRELLGHSDLKMTLRYAHLAPEHKAAAVGLIG